MLTIGLMAAVGTPPTAAYDIMRAVVIFGTFCLLYLIVSVLRAFLTTPEPDDGDSPSPEPDSRATDSDRYTHLMPVVSTVESTEAIAARGAELIPEVADIGRDTFTVNGYAVTLIPLACECPFWEHRGKPELVCKHVVAVAGYVLGAV